jgi:hypothetical protein
VGKEEEENELVEMQSYSLPPVGTTRCCYYSLRAGSELLHDVQLACHA